MPLKILAVAPHGDDVKDINTMRTYNKLCIRNYANTAAKHFKLLPSIASFVRKNAFIKVGIVLTRHLIMLKRQNKRTVSGAVSNSIMTLNNTPRKFFVVPNVEMNVTTSQSTLLSRSGKRHELLMCAEIVENRLEQSVIHKYIAVMDAVQNIGRDSEKPEKKLIEFEPRLVNVKCVDSEK